MPHHLNLQSIQSMALGSCLVSTTTTVCEELKVFNNLSSSSVLIMWQLYFKENWHLTNQLQCQWSPQEMHQITQIVSSTPDGLQWIELFSLAPFICRLYARYHNPHSPQSVSLLFYREIYLCLIALWCCSLWGDFFDFLPMQECSSSFHKQTRDKFRKLERSLECQHEGRKWIVIGRYSGSEAAENGSFVVVNWEPFICTCGHS